MLPLKQGHLQTPNSGGALSLKVYLSVRKFGCLVDIWGSLCPKTAPGVDSINAGGHCRRQLWGTGARAPTPGACVCTQFGNFYLHISPMGNGRLVVNTTHFHVPATDDNNNNNNNNSEHRDSLQ